MSLFKSIEWWGAERTIDEECDFGCLCVADIDNAQDGSHKIITGNFNGILRIYSPSRAEGDSRSHDVLLETKLDGPILQISAGKFVSVSQELHLAVLLPRAVTIYSISIKKGAVDHGNQCILNKIHEHKLERTAANMTFGPFGGVKGKDFLCVQSMDGTLSIFESENFIFMRFIPGFLMPGPLAYCARIDSFITVSSNRCLESYSYQGLAVAASSKTKEESQTITSGKRIKADWDLSLGECALDIKVVDAADGNSLIMVLGERNLYCVRESGQLKYMKKLEYDPVCFYPYISEDSKSVKCIVCSHSKQLLVYDGITLQWAAVIDEPPVQIAVGNFEDIQGMIALLNDSCRVSCCYLGTHPSIFSLPQSGTREMDQLTMEREIAKINEKIRQLHSSKGDILTQAKDTDDLTISIHTPSAIDKNSMAGEQAPMSSEGPVPSATAQIMLKVTRRVTNVSIMIHVEEPLMLSQKHVVIPAIAESDPRPCVTVSFFLGREFSPASLTFEVVVHYQQSGTGNPHVVTASAELPLALVSWPHDPIKTMDHKVTLESSSPCINLLELFPELGSADAGPNCVAVKLIHGPVSTILTSKSSNRYRVQSETYSGLWLVANELIKRIRKYSPSCRITHPQPVSLDDLSPIIDRHFQLRLSKVSVHELLDQRAKQFRAIQRRLLTRFKDKTPAPLNCLDTLLEGTFRQIQALSDACEENALVIVMSSIELSCCLRLIILLTKLCLGLSDKEAQFLEAVLCVNFRDAEMGWEETVESSVATLLRTVLSKPGKDSNNMPSTNTTLQMPNDVSKLKKLIGALFDRLARGGKLVSTDYHHYASSSGSISNITIGQPSDEFSSSKDKFKPSLITRGMSEDGSLNEDDEDALIADIIKSTPAHMETFKTPFELHSPSPENHVGAENGDGYDVLKDKSLLKPSNLEPLMGNLSLSSNAEYVEDANDGEGLEERKESPSFMMSPIEIEPTAKSKDEIYGINDDIMESSSFFDSTSDDTYAM